MPKSDEDKKNSSQRAVEQFEERLENLGEASPVLVGTRKGFVSIKSIQASEVEVDGEQVPVLELFAQSELDPHFRIYNLPESDDPLGHVATLIAQEGATVTEERR
jgi:hypothetical protein